MRKGNFRTSVGTFAVSEKAYGLIRYGVDFRGTGLNLAWKIEGDNQQLGGGGKLPRLL